MSSKSTLVLDKDVSLDLNGHLLAKTGNGVAFQVDAATVVIKDSAATQPTVGPDGKVEYSGGALSGSPSKQLVVVKNGGKLVVESGKLEAKSGDCVFVVGNLEAASEQVVPSTVVVLGGYVVGREYGVGAEGQGAMVEIKGGVIEALDNAVVGGNGTNTAFKYCGGTSISIEDASLVGHTVSSGYVGCGVYHPQAGTLSIKDTSILVDDGIGVLMRGGTLDLSGTSIKTTGTKSGKVGDSKVIGGCYGICVDAESGYYDAANIACSIADVSVDSESDSIKALPEDEQTTAMIDITSGVFSTDPTAYAKGRQVVEENGKYIVA